MPLTRLLRYAPDWPVSPVMLTEEFEYRLSLFVLQFVRFVFAFVCLSVLPSVSLSTVIYDPSRFQLEHMAVVGPLGHWANQ